MADLHATVGAHKRRLLSLPGCTAVAIGKKIVNGQQSDIDCITVFVRKKGLYDPPNEIPKEIDGVPTDVVEREFSPVPLSTDPFERFDPLIGGISVTAHDIPGGYGTIGCFITSNGTAAAAPMQVQPGTYALTNYHVVEDCTRAGHDRRTYQPGKQVAPPDRNILGQYIAGIKDDSHDCAIVAIGARGFANEVPNHPWRIGNRALAGIAAPVVRMKVYKYGATSKHTVGTITHINFNTGGIRNAIYVEGEDGGMWAAPGDSGSVIISYDNDTVVGILFSGDTATPVGNGYSGVFGYDLNSQIALFGGVVQLA